VRFLRTEDERAERARLAEERRLRDENPDRRWEYFVLRVGMKARVDNELNELGSKGWQLVQVVEADGHLAFYMEREILPLEPAAPANDTDEIPLGREEVKGNA
jgi:hypothetical protein